MIPRQFPYCTDTYQMAALRQANSALSAKVVELESELSLCRGRVRYLHGIVTGQAAVGEGIPHLERYRADWKQRRAEDLLDAIMYETPPRFLRRTEINCPPNCS